MLFFTQFNDAFFQRLTKNKAPEAVKTFWTLQPGVFKKRLSTAVEHISSTNHLSLYHYIDIHTYTATQTPVIKKLSITETKTNISGGIRGLQH